LESKIGRIVDDYTAILAQIRPKILGKWPYL